MFGIGMPELILILAIALIVIGPKKLPDLAKSLGRAMREFRKATSELKGSLELDGEMRDVRETFDGIKSDIKDSVLQEKVENRSNAHADAKSPEPETPPADPPTHEVTATESVPETNDADTPPEPEPTQPTDLLDKDR